MAKPEYSKILFIVSIFLAVALAGCSSPKTNSPTLSPSPLSDTVTPHLTSYPSPTLTATPSASAMPTATQPAPTATPAPCIDPTAKPRQLPSRQTPLEVQYNSDGNLWIWIEGTTQAVQVSTTGDASLFTYSPDGQVAVFTRGEADSQQEVWTIRRDGTSLHRLLSAEQLHAWDSAPRNPPTDFNVDIRFVRWLSESRLAMEINRNYRGVGGCCESLGYWQVDVDTAIISSWTPPFEISTLPYVLVSPDGSILAYWGDGGVNLTTRDGWLLHSAAIPFITLGVGEGAGRIYPQLAWASDSQSLGAVTFTEDYTSDQSTFTTWHVPIDGSPVENLANFTGSPYSVQISPDTHYILYTRMDVPNSSERTLHLATLDGKLDLAYSQGEGMEDLGWTPDGFHFLFWQNTTNDPQLGSLCGGSQPLLDPPVSPVRDIEWVDTFHFLFVSGAYGDPDAELRLGEMGGGSIPISKIGSPAYYQFMPDG